MSILLLFSDPSGGVIGKSVSDTANIQVVEAPVDTQSVNVVETAYLVLSETVDTGLISALNRSDTASLSVGEAASISITGPVLFSRTDTASLSLSESVQVAVALAVTDTASIAASDVSAVLVDVLGVSVSDTTSISIAESAPLTVFTTSFPLDVVDTASLTLGEIGAVDATDIVIVRSMKFHIRSPSIRFRMLN